MPLPILIPPVIPGIFKVKHLEENLAAALLELDPSILLELG
jgi:hypothetical protein